MSYYIDAFTLNRCIPNNKGNEGLDDFKNNFYRKIKYNGKKFVENQYDPFLEALYQKSNEEYHECYLKMIRMTLKYVSDNQELLVSLINSNDFELIQVAYEMYKKRGSIISRLIPMRANKISVKESDKKLLKDLEKLLASSKMDDENNVLNKVKEEFMKSFGEYSENTPLSDYYNDIINGIDQEFYCLINNEISKITNLKEYIKYAELDEAFLKNRESIIKAKKIRPLVPKI